MRAETGFDIAISARNVTLSLGSGEARTHVLKGIDLDIGRGDSLAILGPSGSGKSSLMAILSGLEQASGGEVRVAGVDYGPLDEDLGAIELVETAQRRGATESYYRATVRPWYSDDEYAKLPARRRRSPAALA